MLFRKCFGLSDGDGDDDNNNNNKKKKNVIIRDRGLPTEEGGGEGKEEETEENVLLLGSGKNKTKKSTDPFVQLKENALLEIVGATGLVNIKGDDDIDSFCIVKIIDDDNNKNNVQQVHHRTKIITNDTNPIWTVKTNSLCLLEHMSPTSKVKIELCYSGELPLLPDIVQVKSIVPTIVFGNITLTSREILQGTSERKEYIVTPNNQQQKYPGDVILAIRSRRAMRQDFLHFFDQKKKGNIDSSSRSNSKPSSPTTSSGLHAPLSRGISRTGGGGGGGISTSPQHHDHGHAAADTDFNMVSTKTIFKARKKTITIINDDPSSSSDDDDKKQKKNKKVTATAYRVWPYPDPTNPIETEYMTEQQLCDVALQPSKNWTEAGTGEYGQIYLEILGCDDLPNMDTELIDGLTDTFVACLFEGKFVRTSVIHDSLRPRFPPWSSRAFSFKIMHPSSILYLGVFDYDEGLLEQHDPIGRVVIHLDKFETGTMYTLRYPLINGETGKDGQGSMTLRLRIHWNDEAKVAKAQAFVKPPRFVINVKTDQGLQVLRFLTGRHISEVTTQSVKLYVNEIISHWKKYCYLWDVLFSIWLWRGRTNLSTLGGGRKISIWFPIDSILLFGGLVFAVERPGFIPSIFLYAMAYCLLANNYYLSTNPNPWSRVRSFKSTFATKNLGMKSSSSNIHIEPNEGINDAKTLRLLDEYKAHRVTGFLYEFIMTMLNVYRVYSKTSPVDFSTEKKKSSLNVGAFFAKFYENYLRYLHLMLRILCKYIRVLRNFVNWNTLGTYKFTTNLLLLATAWAFFPSKHLAIWPIRVFVWLFFGPWVKLLDVFWIHEYYRTKEELLRDGIPETKEEMIEDIANRPNILDPILRTAWFHKTSLSGRIVIEENLKLHAFRELKFGQFTELVPSVDTSRYPSVPDSSSFAQPYGDGTGTRKGDYKDIPPDEKQWSYASGQKLSGLMIPVHIHEEAEN